MYFKQTFSNDKSLDDYATTMVGSVETCPFGGIYDGGGHRLDFRHLDESVSTVAPFRYIKNATIKHLYLYCNDVRGGIHVSGLVGATVGDGNTPPTNIIEDCRVGGLIYSYGTQAGGFIGHGGGANNILRGCLFDGTLQSENTSSTTYAAPFIGWCEYTTDDRSTLQGCFAKGTYTDFNYTALYFVNGTDKTKGVKVDRTYHNQEWNDGHHAYTITSRTEGMSIEYFFTIEPGITCTDYSTSGIKIYTGTTNGVGIVLYDVDKNVLYLKSGETVAFKIISSSADYSFTNISADKGTLVKPYSGGVEYDLTMTSANSVITGRPYVVLYNSDNSTKLRNINEMKGVTVKLNNRTLSKNGMWNTLCLPFTLTVANSPLAGATIKTLDGASLSDDGTLSLNFSENSPTTITAGTPFIVKWENAEDTKLQNPVFRNVTISNTLNDVSISGVLTFKGIFSPYAISGEDKTMLYLDTDNKLCYPNDAMTIGACRAYFQLADGITAGEPASAGAKSISHIVLNFGDDVATGISQVTSDKSQATSGKWYSLDGRRLTSKPTQKGIYINNGIKVVIK